MFGYSFLIGCLFWAIALVHCELVDDRAAWDNVQCYNTADSIRTCQSCVSIYDESKPLFVVINLREMSTFSLFSINLYQKVSYIKRVAMKS